MPFMNDLLLNKQGKLEYKGDNGFISNELNQSIKVVHVIFTASRQKCIIVDK